MAKRNRPYGLLAKHYDAIVPMAPAMNRHARRAMLGRILERAASVCDLACGSGDTALDLARAGKRVVAVDASTTFCERTSARARDADLDVRVIRADMRRFRLAQPVDLVLCEFSALNNLDTRRDLVAVFRAAARALVPGGHFLFDVNTPLSFKTQYGQTSWFETAGFKLVIRGEPLTDRGRRAVLHCEWFEPRGRAFRHVRESIVNVCWSDAEIRAALRKAGLELVRVADGTKVRPPMKGAVAGTDVYYLARKPPG